MTRPPSDALFRPTPETAPFWEGVRTGVLRLPRCRDCGAHHFYPRARCPHCWSRNLEWVTARGTGRLHAFTINYRPPAHCGPGPVIVAIVELDEGPRLMTELVGVDPDPARLRCDMPVEAVFEPPTAGVRLPKFRPAGGPQ